MSPEKFDKSSYFTMSNKCNPQSKLFFLLEGRELLKAVITKSFNISSVLASRGTIIFGGFGLLSFAYM